MKKIVKNVTELIGETPLMEVCRFEEELEITQATILAKLEYLNPAGSIKDRVAFNMINDGRKKGLIKPGATIIEPTSGNTGIGLAMAAAAMGYKTILTLPETMSEERRRLLRAYGAQLVLTEGSKGMQGAIDRAVELNKEIENSIILGQFDNLANPKTHYMTTGPEIWDQTEGNVDIVVAGVGTGGTITGIGQYLKEQNPDIKVVAFEPYNSAVLSGEKPGSHNLQGIGGGFVPSALDTQIYDEIIKVKDEEAYKAGNILAKKEGILCGITSGAALHVAAMLAKRPENKDKTIVAILPDSGDRYLSTPLYE